MGRQYSIFGDEQYIEGALSKKALDGVHHFWDFGESFRHNFGGYHFTDL